MRFQIAMMFWLLMVTGIAAQVRADIHACPKTGSWIQILGSGGPEVLPDRASASYLLWHQGKARILIDMGSGSFLRFRQSGAAIEDLDAVAFTHFHIDHSVDFPALIKASYFSHRNRPLALFGPQGNRFLVSADAFTERLLGSSGAWPYMSDYLDGSARYQIVPSSIGHTRKPQVVWQQNRLSLTAISVPHGPLPALAWRINTPDGAVVISGDTSNVWRDGSGQDRQEASALLPLLTLPENAGDSHVPLYIAHHAVPETAFFGALRLHMPPSLIARDAAEAGLKRVVLSHLMTRSLNAQDASEKEIRKVYSGELIWASDLLCVPLAPDL